MEVFFKDGSFFLFSSLMEDGNHLFKKVCKDCRRHGLMILFFQNGSGIGNLRIFLLNNRATRNFFNAEVNHRFGL